MLKFWLPGLIFLFSLSLLALAKGPALSPEKTQSAHASESSFLGDPDTLELGAVQWRRSFDQALAAAEESGKPVFILFQEVPGCLNCQRFGKEVMSHPLIVDAIEEAFVPVVVFNNHRGPDREVLSRYGEPTWNNPVVRIVDAKGKDLVKRMPSFHPQEVVNGMVQALQEFEAEVPLYLELLQRQFNAHFGQTETGVFPMYCFWSGELALGQLDGVVKTQPGFMNGREVVKVDFDPAHTSYGELVRVAKQKQAIEGAYVKGDAQANTAAIYFNHPALKATASFRQDGEPKYYLYQTAYRHLPMLPLQQIEVNRALYQRRDAEVYLSPSQKEALGQVAKGKSKLGEHLLLELP